MSGKYALIIGNTEYIDPGLAQLTAPGKDAEDFAQVLKDPDIGAFDHVKVLLNQLSSTVSEAIDEFFDQKKPDDLLVLYFSGHGVRDELGALYLAVQNTIRSRLRSTAIKSDYIRDVMDQSRSKRQVLILDCCNSGAFTQGTKAATGVSIGTASAFESGFGRIILTASDSTQFAWEGDRVIGETDNSLFTHYLVEGLKGDADNDGDGRITVDELYDYAYEMVRRATPKQTPSKFSSKQQGEIILRQSMRIEDIKPVPLSVELIDEIEDTRPYVREAAVQKLEKIIKGRNLGLARSAIEALEKVSTDENTTRRVAQAATQILESFRQVEQKAEAERKAKEEEERTSTLKAEEAGFSREKVEAEQKATDEADKLLQARAEREAAEREASRLKADQEAAERLAAQKIEEERLKKQRAEQRRIAREKSKAELKAKEQASPVSARKPEAKKVIGGSVQNNSAELSDKLGEFLAYGQVKWNALVNYLRNMPRTRSKIYTRSALVIFPVTIIGFLFYGQLSNDSLYFSGTTGGEINVYSYIDETITKVTAEDKNWSPYIGFFGQRYFTSDRTGKAEIYEIKPNGDVQQITDTPGDAESWSPVVGFFGQRYFTSNRTGKAEIYEIKPNGDVQQITDTPGGAESWSPAIGLFGQRYFTSDRTGKAEIYEIKSNGDVQQITDTPGDAESWSPTAGPFGQLYFTSNRTGKAEIYEIGYNGSVRQITDTPGNAESWSPIIRGRTIYFTSNRQGYNSVYMMLTPQAIPITSLPSWTKTLAERYPSSDP